MNMERFNRNVRLFGRNFELWLLMEFYLRTLLWTNPLKMLKMSPLAWKLWRRGRLHPLPDRIRGRGDLVKIIERAEQIDRPQEREAVRPPTDKVGYKAIQSE